MLSVAARLQGGARRRVVAIGLRVQVPVDARRRPAALLPLQGAADLRIRVPSLAEGRGRTA